jgi:hypothetical protein
MLIKMFLLICDDHGRRRSRTWKRCAGRLSSFAVEAPTPAVRSGPRPRRLQSRESLDPSVPRLVVLGAEDVVGVLLLVVQGANEEGMEVGVLAGVGGSRGLSADGSVGKRNLPELAPVPLSRESGSVSAPQLLVAEAKAHSIVVCKRSPGRKDVIPRLGERQK